MRRKKITDDKVNAVEIFCVVVLFSRLYNKGSQTDRETERETFANLKLLSELKRWPDIVLHCCSNVDAGRVELNKKGKPGTRLKVGERGELGEVTELKDIN